MRIEFEGYGVYVYGTPEEAFDLLKMIAEQKPAQKNNKRKEGNRYGLCAERLQYMHKQAKKISKAKGITYQKALSIASKKWKSKKA